MALSEEELTRNILALDEGLRRIWKQFDEHVVFAYGDPLTFSPGHFVLHPREGPSPRFAIEEQYPPGVDWQDDDRLPISWTWFTDAALQQPDGSWRRVTLAEGEVVSQDYRKLLTIAEAWAQALRDATLREQALTPDPPVAGMTRREDPERTWLA